MRKNSGRMAFLLLFGLLSSLLVACGEDSTATPAATTTTTTTTASSQGTVSATLSATTAAATTTAASVSLTIPAGNTYPGDLEIYRKVLEAYNKTTSFKFTVTGNATNLSGIFVKPDKIAGTLDTGGQKSSVVLAGKDFYFSADGKTWQKLSGDSGITQVTGRLNEIFPKDLAGSTFAVLPDEKLDGQNLGVFSLDTSTATVKQAPDVAGSKFTFKYDKSTYLVVQVLVKGPSGDASLRYSDYDSPSNKVEVPSVT
jgi:hypothetical protein